MECAVPEGGLRAGPSPPKSEGVVTPRELEPWVLVFAGTCASGLSLGRGDPQGQGC